MNKVQKNNIVQMRLDGIGYSRISATLGISINTVKSFCRRYKLQGNGAVIAKNYEMAKCNNDICMHCGKPFKQKEKCKPKKFCSDKCRAECWKIYNQKE